MFKCQCLRGLEFANYPFLNEQIGEIFPNLLIIIKDGNRRLLPGAKATFLQFDQHRVLIDFFQKSCA
ncbi:MAG: hypothetical protein A2V91_07115 [Candidatus Muproteobacteria bacterium RBG_16_64_10]|uniref:Uncharacterized protein n=1 Tax=Candidatus Muproteobacteria bacterium RBG_16_64_10 TaxID=1817757 RepID=A0A1F6T5H1_9PROT|nr:MAG: hypothetical protein A2V91_07115 [Candidatus Muproteobacteria bacterium RBG_16_64_10]